MGSRDRGSARGSPPNGFMMDVVAHSQSDGSAIVRGVEKRPGTSDSRGDKRPGTGDSLDDGSSRGFVVQQGSGYIDQFPPRPVFGDHEDPGPPPSTCSLEALRARSEANSRANSVAANDGTRAEQSLPLQ